VLDLLTLKEVAWTLDLFRSLRLSIARPRLPNCVKGAEEMQTMALPSLRIAKMLMQDLVVAIARVQLGSEIDRPG
jgi:hypothetical protein